MAKISSIKKEIRKKASIKMKILALKHQDHKRKKTFQTNNQAKILLLTCFYNNMLRKPKDNKKINKNEIINNKINNI